MAQGVWADLFGDPGGFGDPAHNPRCAVAIERLAVIPVEDGPGEALPTTRSTARAVRGASGMHTILPPLRICASSLAGSPHTGSVALGDVVETVSVGSSEYMYCSTMPDLSVLTPFNTYSLPELLESLAEAGRITGRRAVRQVASTARRSGSLPALLRLPENEISQVILGLSMYEDLIRSTADGIREWAGVSSKDRQELSARERIVVQEARAGSIDIFLLLMGGLRDFLLSDPVQFIITCHFLWERQRRGRYPGEPTGKSINEYVALADVVGHVARDAINSGHSMRFECTVAPNGGATFTLHTIPGSAPKELED